LNSISRNLKIVALAGIVIFVFIVNAWAVDIIIDKAISLNFYFRSNEKLISELKIDKLDIKGAALSGSFILKAKVLKDGLTGKLYSSNMTLDSSALPDLKVFFKLTKDKLKIYSLNFGEFYRLRGDVSLKEPFETNVCFEILRANLRDIAIITKAKRPGVVTGVMSGVFNIKGPIDNLQSSGFIGGRSGKIGPIWYDSADIKIHGIGPIISIVDSNIRQAQATFTMEGYIDLRSIARSDLMSYMKLKSDMKTIVWDGWDISKYGSDSIKMIKDIGDNVSVGFRTFAREELLPYQKRENLDEVSLEYKLDNGQIFQMKLKENEEFFGVERKKKF